MDNAFYEAYTSLENKYLSNGVPFKRRAKLGRLAGPLRGYRKRVDVLIDRTCQRLGLVLRPDAGYLLLFVIDQMVVLPQLMVGRGDGVKALLDEYLPADLELLLGDPTLRDEARPEVTGRMIIQALGRQYANFHTAHHSWWE